MADPLDPARLYERYLAAQKGRGLGDLFQEEGPGLGPSSQLSKVISTLRESGKGQIQSGMDPRIVNPQIERRIAEERQGESLRRIEELAPKGLEAEFAKIKSMQKSPKFAGPEDNISRLERDKLRLQKAENLDLSNDFISPLDEIAEQLAKINAPTGASDEAIAQDIVAEKQRGQSAEEFRAEEARLAEGMMPEMGADPQNVQKALDETFASAMDDFINSARGAGPDKKERTLDDYKKEFAEATGVDISGKVDKSSALMSMGLALMQNRAGKGFNVGRMLSAVGKAGSAALPALEKAKAKAQTAALAAGKYALESRASDKAKDEATKESLKNRSQYYVYKKGEEGEAFANFDQGDLAYLNKYELNKLMANPKFNDKFSFIEGSDYFELMKNDANQTAADYGDPYGKEAKVSLLGGDIEGVNPIYIVDAQRPDGNYKGARKQYSYMQTAPESVVANFKKEQDSILKEEEQFAELIGNIETGVSIPKQIVSSVIGFGRNLGLNLGDGPTPIAKARRKLEQIQLMNATEILQESGKTLSDQDRERVKQFVGSIDLASADEEMILRTIGRVYDIVLKARQRDLNTAVGNMERDFGISVDLRPENKPSNQAELDAMNKKDGTNLTMDDFNKPAET